MTDPAPHFVVRPGLGDTHAEIVLHAAHLFGSLGYTKTNIGEIAERVGMSPGNLYRYYKNKQAIGEEVVRSYLVQSEAVMEAAIASATDPEASLRAMFAVGIGGVLASLREAPRMVELADMICTGDSGILRSHLEWKVATFERLLHEGHEARLWHVDAPPAFAETLLDATRAFWNPASVAVLDPARVPARITRVLDALLAGIRVG